jgi:alpha-L-rhamnosidase
LPPIRRSSAETRRRWRPSLTQPGTPAIFRKEFTLPGAVKRAVIYATARGLFELRANGQRVGDDWFAPEWTDYDKRIHYRTYDVSAVINAGANRLEVTLGDGWWSGFVGWQEQRGRYGSLENSLLVQLEVELDGGRRLTLGTGRNWQRATGPILSSDFMMGEIYDARRTPQGWLPAREVAPPPVPLVTQRSEPIRTFEEFAPVSVNAIRSGVWIYDLGQNIAGFVRLKLAGVPAGTELTLRHGERLNPDGTIYVENLRRAKATDVDIAGGDAEETYSPHFTFHGFQYVELSGVSGRTAARHRHRMRHPFGHARRRSFRVLAPGREPPLVERRVVAAGQLHQRADRLPAARRAAGLDGRRPGCSSARRATT